MFVHCVPLFGRPFHMRAENRGDPWFYAYHRSVTEDACNLSTTPLIEYLYCPSLRTPKPAVVALSRVAHNRSLRISRVKLYLFLPIVHISYLLQS